MTDAKDTKPVGPEKAVEQPAVEQSPENAPEALGEPGLEVRAVGERRGMFGDPSVLLPYEFRWRMRGRSSAKLVGSLSRGEVYDLAERERVPIWDRVFFFDARDVRAPFFRATGERHGSEG